MSDVSVNVYLSRATRTIASSKEHCRGHIHIPTRSIQKLYSMLARRSEAHQLSSALSMNLPTESQLTVWMASSLCPDGAVEAGAAACGAESRVAGALGAAPSACPEPGKPPAPADVVATPGCNPAADALAISSASSASSILLALAGSSCSGRKGISVVLIRKTFDPRSMQH